MRLHIFIVNDDTFPIHLQYLFAGTGAYSQKRKVWVDEHIGLLSDIKRVRVGDFVIFYIEATSKVKGGFYGIFRIANQNPIVFHTPGSAGFQPSLYKQKLIYRTLIEPYEVYSKGIPEYEALDKLPNYATEIQWSLIYRKLKGKRGCTPLLPWEAQRLVDMLRNKNSGKILASTKFNAGLDWDRMKREIVVTNSKSHYPGPRNFNFAPLNELCKRMEPGRGKIQKEAELLLQLYFTEYIGIDQNLNSIVGNNPVWFGNEVACGVGMQKIDILSICSDNNRREFRIIELKCQPITPNIIEQIRYYVNWASCDDKNPIAGKHLEGAYNWNIQPVIVAPQHSKKHDKNTQPTKQWQKIISAIKCYNQEKISLPILYFEFTVKCGKTITFTKVSY